MSDRYARVIRAVVEHPWAIVPAVLETILGVIQMRVDGARLSADEIQARVGSPTRPEAQRVGNVAILPLHGVLAQRMNMFMEISGGTSTELFGQQLRAALADPEVAAVVIDIDSPGGSVFGIEELAQAIFNARGDKPIVAVADSLAASAAYWLAVQADQFVVSPSGQVGSIGVFAVHEDRSKADETAGVKHTLIKAGKHKTAGNEYEPLTEDAQAVMQANIDEYFDLFVRAVARGRGVSPSAVRNGFGEGAALPARPALAAGMVDRIETLSDVVTRLSSPQGRRAARTQASASTRASDATPQEPETATGQEPSLSRLDAERLRIELDSLCPL
jgi:capsid assembly protease